MPTSVAYVTEKQFFFVTVTGALVYLALGRGGGYRGWGTGAGGAEAWCLSKWDWTEEMSWVLEVEVEWVHPLSYLLDRICGGV